MKYSFEMKLKAAKQYLEYGTYEIPIGFNSNSGVYRNHVKDWAAKYLVHGEDGLRHGFNKVYSPEQKMRIIKPILNLEVSCTERAHILGLSPALLLSWVKRYREKGFDGLKCSKRGRPRKNMESDKKPTEPADEPVPQEQPSYPVDAQEEIRRLKEELLYAKAENLYLKKLSALVEERERRERLKKHRRSRKSSKARN